MSQRVSGFARLEHDLYPTPAWVVAALAEHVDLAHKGIWEPACGTGEMVKAIVAAGVAYAHATDIVDHGYSGMDDRLDFLKDNCRLTHYDGIITNPPYGHRGELAEAFIRRGLRKTADYGFLALLLPVDFDSAVKRRALFADCPYFAGKIILTQRIKWFDGPSSPSANHAWFLWQRTWIGERQTPRLLYAPRELKKEKADD